MANYATVRPCHGCGAWLIERLPGTDTQDVVYKDERDDRCPRCGAEWYPVARLVRAGDVLLKGARRARVRQELEHIISENDALLRALAE